MSAGESAVFRTGVIRRAKGRHLASVPLNLTQALHQYSESDWRLTAGMVVDLHSPLMIKSRHFVYIGLLLLPWLFIGSDIIIN